MSPQGKLDAFTLKVIEPSGFGVGLGFGLGLGFGFGFGAKSHDEFLLKSYLFSFDAFLEPIVQQELDVVLSSAVCSPPDLPSLNKKFNVPGTFFTVYENVPSAF